MLIALAAFAFVLLIIALEVAANFFSGPRLRREVVINTHSPDDKTVRGILVHRDRRWLRLEGAKFADGENWIDLDGTLNIPAGHVSYVQVL